jgi:hypothetical protein
MAIKIPDLLVPKQLDNEENFLMSQGAFNEWL